MSHEAIARWDDSAFAEAMELVRSRGLIDLHVDPIILQRLFGFDVARSHRAGVRGQPFIGHADLPRLREGGHSGVCLGIHYYPWESEGAWTECVRQIEYLDRIVAEDAGCLRVREPADWGRALAAGKMGVQPGVEGGHMLNGRVERVAELARLGVAYLTLVHLGPNSLGSPCFGWRPRDARELTPFGRDVLRALNRWGITVDIAHISMRGVLDACELATAPLMASHSGARGVHPHPRLLTDEAIDAIAARDGCIGIIYAPKFLTGRLRVSAECIVDHAAYIAARVGHRHVSLGSDFDGWIPAIPNDMRDCRDTVRIVHRLLQRGFRRDEVADICWNNAIRVMSAAWDARTERAVPDAAA